MTMQKKEAILIISAGIMQIPAIKTAKSLGLYVVATDRNPQAEGFAFCDEAVVIDSKDIAGHVKFAQDNQQRLNLKAVFAGSDIAVTVAAVTNALGLPGIPMDVAQRSNNKVLMKQRWIEDGIPTPYGAEVSSEEEALKILEKIGFPAIVKAVDNAASRGSMKIDSVSQLALALHNAKQASKTGTAIIEQYVIGTEQSVETIIWNNKHYHVGMADREFGFHPYHIETAHVDPSVLDETRQQQIYDVVDAAARSLGITFGPAKADMILTAQGPMILEMTARLSGGFHSQYTTPLSSGKNPIKAVMELALNRPLDEKLLQDSVHKTAVCSGLFPPKGKIKAIHGLEKARSIPGVAEIILTRKAGDYITDFIDNGCRFCWVITVAANVEEAKAIVAEVANTIHFDIAQDT
ncbi:ATP-grasp domain-containing protein [Alishewanella sp. HL-SH05]|uniref:ATP-grasp domain-containing protein n=1 Tax=Alishewanella sp. HL-SH05 TaxID=3461145 RepID=UPI00404251B3